MSERVDYVLGADVTAVAQSKKHPRPMLLAVRVTVEEMRDIEQRALEADVTVSQIVRRALFGRAQ